MSGPNEKSMTHDSFGTEPAGVLTFELKWKSSGEAGIDDDVPFEITDNFDTTEKRNWNKFKETLRNVSQGCGHKITEHITYIDSDGDEIPIESQCEFAEALNFARSRAAKKQSVHLVIEKNIESKVLQKNNEIKNSESVNLISLETENTQEEHKQSIMPPMQLNGRLIEAEQRQWQSQRCNVTQATQVQEGLGDTAPKWFINYMQTMKEDIVTEVSKRVTKTVMEALQKKRESQYDSATSQPHTSDSDCPLNGDLVEDLFDHFVEKSREEKNSWMDHEATNSPETREKKTSDASLRSGVYRFDNSHRRYRHADKQRKKHNKNYVSHTPCTEETWHSPSSNRRRGEKAAKKREIDEANALPHSSGNSVRSEQNREKRDFRDAEENCEEFDTPYRRMMASENRRPSATSLESYTLEGPILKLRLASLSFGSNTDKKVTKDKVRMACSVTGQDMLEKPNDRVSEYDALSDSDNISIISDVSHTSDMQRINNSFELILQRSMNFADEAETYENNHTPIITTEFSRADCEIDDLDNARDSSSFELLSEPPSPALSIHMDEDHFSPGECETNNYNINDEAADDKRGNQSKIEKCPFAIDAQGKIYQQNIIDGDETRKEIVLEKRTGGAYSFVGETLPGSTKESVIITENQFEGFTNEVSDDTAEASENAACDPNIEIHINVNRDSQTRGNSTDVFHESTQSFHSHTASQAEKDRQDFEAFSSTSKCDEAPNTPRSHVFVDRNASKGLGETKRTSPRKQRSAGNKNPDEGRSERPRSSRWSFNESHPSGTRSSNSRQGDRSRRFSNWSTTRSNRMMDDWVFNAVDPMHILPETLVIGAVHVASSAYTTARRVYDKILTAQTRKPADKSKFGRR